jgi:hypothetical protein
MRSQWSFLPCMQPFLSAPGPVQVTGHKKHQRWAAYLPFCVAASHAVTGLRRVRSVASLIETPIFRLISRAPQAAVTALNTELGSVRNLGLVSSSLCL